MGLPHFDIYRKIPVTTTAADTPFDLESAFTGWRDWVNNRPIWLEEKLRGDAGTF